jgi:hypothetical protein
MFLYGSCTYKLGQHIHNNIGIQRQTTLPTIINNHGQQSSTTMVKHRQQTWSNDIKHHGQHHQIPWSTIIKHHGQTSSNTIVTKTQIVKNHVQT